MTKPSYRWTRTPPRAPGLYWHRYSDGHEPSIVKVFRERADERELTIQYGDLDMDPAHEDASIMWLSGWSGRQGGGSSGAEDHQWAGPVTEPIDTLSYD